MGGVNELYVDSVQFSYPGTSPIITGGYIKCRLGDVIGLLGRNGCGKSTFLKIIFGSLTAQNSYITINGKRTRKAYLSNKIGYLPQDSFLPTYEKVFTVICLLVDRGYRQEILDDDRIKNLLNRKIYQLSGGERRYLEVFLLICQPTDYLLLDEPFTGIDPIYINHILDLIRRFKIKKGFVVSDHNYRYVLSITDQIFLLENGGCKQIRDKKELEFFYVPEGTFTK